MPAETPSLRPIALLSVAAFAAAATMRIADPLLPQVGEEFSVSPGAASVIVTAFSLAYGLCQVVYGPLGDRVGKYRVIAVAMALAGVAVGACALAPSLEVLALLRLVSGATAAAAIPLSIAYIGDIVPYADRQAVLARFISGQITGLIFGQVFGGIAIELANWRGAFVLLALIYFAVAVLLAIELRSGRVVEPTQTSPGGLATTVWRYLGLFRSPRVRLTVLAVGIEGMLFFGSFAYLGAFMRHEHGLDYIAVGLLLGCFGLGGLAYTAMVRPVMARLGERGMVIAGGAVLAGSFLALTVRAGWWALGPIVAAIGFGFYMLHNTLQTKATQMAPEARGTAVSLFALVFFLGQSVGVPVAGVGVDGAGFRPVFAAAGIGLLLLGLWFATVLAAERRAALRE